jgi:hypothetical protein
VRGVDQPSHRPHLPALRAGAAPAGTPPAARTGDATDPEERA